ncbi:MAG: tRNA preQ1(34) S-adenosylmethionine ribosyltransferase-isomerase QueA [Rhodospirillales bacterium]|nr:tRNA preQ1(34) S-adenosylmethionine ribosyltransferase-isomerase QueA [Rhodospirillales bacterium]
MRTSDFDFDLPRERIAQHPAYPRDSARLLRIGERLEDRLIRDLPDLLRAGDLLVGNDTKVIPAKLDGFRGQAHIGLTLHQRLDALRWRAFAKPAKKLREGDRIVFAPDLSADVAAKLADGEVELVFQAEGDLLAILDRVGRMPLPPYIKRGADDDDLPDRFDYQTVFAANPGAVAAPTAGLHFSPALLEALKIKGIGRTTITLHVGAGTFLPVKFDDPKDHRMHREWGTIGAEAAQAIAEARARGGRIVAIGTTALRRLESAATAEGTVGPVEGETDLFILPGYRFKIVDLLLTNFHLPRSTLFMLVAAFSGLERMKAAYVHAVANDYRFFSYGDACLLEPEVRR